MNTREYLSLRGKTILDMRPVLMQPLTRPVRSGLSRAQLAYDRRCYRADAVDGLVIPPKVDPKKLAKDLTSRSNRLGSQFYLEVFDKDGKFVGRSKSAVTDMLLNNFGAILATLFHYPSNTYPPIAVVDYAGNSKNIVGYGINAVTKLPWSYAGTLPKGAMVCVGSGSTIVRTDYKVQTLLGAWTASSTTTPNYGTGSNIVTVAGSVVLAAGGSVTEAGVGLDMIDDNGSAIGPIMCAHDAVSPTVTVPAGGSCAVNWSLQL